MEREELAFGDCVVRHQHAEYGPGWLFFSSPRKTIASATIDGMATSLSLLESEVDGGAFAVGFLSYEAGSAFDTSLPSPGKSEIPLLWFLTYDQAPEFVRELFPVYGDSKVRIQSEWDLRDYSERFCKVKDVLAQGGAYQVNLTSRLRIKTSDSMFELFRRVCGTQPPPYATYIHRGDREIASFSPELFLKRIGGRVVMSPMKGTRKDDDRTAMDADPKSMAENLMIVDMVRNDLGRIAKVGSVQTTKLFEIESHRTVRQMTSRIEAETSVGFAELMDAVFPPASVTGAPKVAACNLIHDLETSPREIYCGAIGILEPGGDARFSVAIRTAWKSDSGVSYGIGSGIVWDSDLDEEYKECLLKAEVLTKPAPQWELVECFHRDAVFDPLLLEDHWQRASASAMALGIPLERAAFDEIIGPLKGRTDLPNKIRVAIWRDGHLSVSVSESAISSSLRATIAKAPVSSRDPNLAHKTSSRQVFEDALASREGFDEVLLYNERGEVAEFCRGNAVFRFGDRVVTPTPGSGCLAGVGAKRLVGKGKGKASYGVVTLREARGADEVWFVNSIRGLIPVEMDWDPEGHK